MKAAKIVAGLLFLAMVCLAAAAVAAEPQTSERRIVVFAPGTSAAERQAIARSAGGTVIGELGLISALVVETPASAAKAAENKLRGHAAVVRVDEDPELNWLSDANPKTFHDAPLPDLTAWPPRFKSSSLQEIPWGVARGVNAPAAWRITRGAGVKVAVIDTGLDASHPDLKANVAGGWNVIAKSADFADDNGHGTHCAGTIAAVDDQAGVVGVAPMAALYGVKVLDAGGSGTVGNVIAGMQWAVENRMQIASMSLSVGKGNDSLKAAVQALEKAGVTLIAAAGNSGGAVRFPAAYPGALAVAAMDSSFKAASFSSRGPEVALIAPGVDVKSTIPSGGYAEFSGTSMATPHVAGLAALAISGKGLTTPAAVRAALTRSARPLAGVPAEQQGAGLPDAARLLK